MFKRKESIHYAGWEIHEFSFSNRRLELHEREIGNPKMFTPIPHFSARRHGVSMNTNSLEGIKRMIDQKNLLTSK